MSIITWFLLPKALTDSETIEEMVDRKIAEHEADPESHMGEGESIDVHRKTEIIDHPSNSIYADKFTTNETIVLQQYTASTEISHSGTHLFDDGVESRLIADYIPPQNFYYINRTTPNVIANIFEKNAQYTALIKISYEYLTGQKTRVGIGYGTTFENTEGLFIERDDNGYRVHVNKRGHNEYSDYISYDDNRFFAFRIEYTHAETMTRFYFNGTKVFEVDYLYEQDITEQRLISQIKLTVNDSVAICEVLNEQWARGL